MNIKEDLSVESTRVNYIFSFFFASTINNEKKILNWGTNDKNGKPLKNIFLDEINTSNLYSNIEFHQSEEREPLINRSAIYFNFPHLSLNKSSRKATISEVFSKELTGEIRIHIALFETGMGVMWISIQFDDTVTFDEISTISRRKSIPKIVFDGNDSNLSQSPYDLFHQEVEILVTKMNTILDLHPIKLNSHYENYKYIWDSKFWVDNNNDYGRGDNISQEPSIAIMIKSRNYSNFLDELDFQLLLSSILHGTNFDDLDRSHAKEHINANYANLYPNKKFVTNLHGNCLIVFHNEEYENSTSQINEYNQFKEFSYGLFRTYCSVRGTWHIYNLLNEEIDEKLTSLNSKIDNNFTGIKKADEIKQNIIFKSHFLQLLTSEDPFVRGIGLTPFAKLHSEASSVYKTDDIKESIKYKLNEYDKLISLINNFDFYRKTSSSQGKFKISMTPVILLSLLITTLIIKFFNFFPFKYNNITYIFLTIVFSISLIFYMFFNKLAK